MGLYIKGLVLTDEIKGMLQQLNAMDMVIEVKTPHGRLIDADKYDYSGDLIYEPTIIEAEEE